MMGEASGTGRASYASGRIHAIARRAEKKLIASVNVLDGFPAVPYIGIAMRLYYRAYCFTYRYSFKGERAGETCAAGLSKTS
jgi:hypothetical protein